MRVFYHVRKRKHNDSTDNTSREADKLRISSSMVER